MEITDIDYEPVNFELRKEFKFGDFCLSKLEYVLVRIETRDGLMGLGEAPAYWDPNGETQESVIGALDLMEDKIKGSKVSQINKVNQKWDRNCREAYSARCAVDLALYDLLGKKLDVPAYKILGGENGQVKMPETIPLNFSLEDAEKKVRETDGNLFKMKADSDIERLNKIATCITEAKKNPKIALDANQTWRNPVNASRKISGLNFEPKWIEQPIRSSDVKGLSKLDSVIMADESFYSVQDFRRIKDYVDMFNIKLAKSGGLSKAAQLARMIESENKRYIAGSMLESPIGSMAAYQFSKAFRPVWMEASGCSLIKGVNRKFDLQGENLTKNDKPGLGISPEDLGRYYPF